MVLGHDVRWVYELHLGVELPAWTPPDRYPAAATGGEGRRVGVDLGVSSVAVVGVDTVGVTGALLVTASTEDRAAARDARLVARRRDRALERSRRASNPHAYGSDKRGRPVQGSRKPGTRLVVSNTYRTLRAQQADATHRAAAERRRRIDHLAIDVVATFGPSLLVEKTSTRAWMRLWGASIGRFAPATVLAALDREAVRAGGTLIPIDTPPRCRSTASAAHARRSLCRNAGTPATEGSKSVHSRAERLARSLVGNCRGARVNSRHGRWEFECGVAPGPGGRPAWWSSQSSSHGGWCPVEGETASVLMVAACASRAGRSSGLDLHPTDGRAA
ncbi:MAG: hypothetical protein JWP76_5885 [Dactylosporangium sp.]|nr:hypothetical protein [Dactylosporangium sp.]